MAGHLLFVRDQVLYAQPLDLSRLQLTGDPVALAENVATFTTSNNGVAAYVSMSLPGQATQTELLWRDRGGQVLERIEQAAGVGRPTLSPDGRRVAMGLRGDTWIFELNRRVLSRLASPGGSGGAT